MFFCSPGGVAALPGFSLRFKDTPSAYHIRLLFVFFYEKLALDFPTKADRRRRTDEPQRESVSESEKLGDEGAASGIF